MAASPLVLSRCELEGEEGAPAGGRKISEIVMGGKILGRERSKRKSGQYKLALDKIWGRAAFERDLQRGLLENLMDFMLELGIDLPLWAVTTTWNQGRGLLSGHDLLQPEVALLCCGGVEDGRVQAGGCGQAELPPLRRRLSAAASPGQYNYRHIVMSGEEPVSGGVRSANCASADRRSYIGWPKRSLTT